MLAPSSRHLFKVATTLTGFSRGKVFAPGRLNDALLKFLVVVDRHNQNALVLQRIWLPSAEAVRPVAARRVHAQTRVRHVDEALAFQAPLLALPGQLLRRALLIGCRSVQLSQLQTFSWLCLAVRQALCRYSQDPISA